MKRAISTTREALHLSSRSLPNSRLRVRLRTTQAAAGARGHTQSSPLRPSSQPIRVQDASVQTVKRSNKSQSCVTKQMSKSQDSLHLSRVTHLTASSAPSCRMVLAISAVQAVPKVAVLQQRPQAPSGLTLTKERHPGSCRFDTHTRRSILTIKIHRLVCQPACAIRVRQHSHTPSRSAIPVRFNTRTTKACAQSLQSLQTKTQSRTSIP